MSNCEYKKGDLVRHRSSMRVVSVIDSDDAFVHVALPGGDVRYWRRDDCELYRNADSTHTSVLSPKNTSIRLSELLPDALFLHSKDWTDSGPLERVDWLLGMYRSKCKELDEVYGQLATGVDSERGAILDRADEGRKDDAGKLRLDLIPPEATIALGKVLTMGAAKYDDRNWEKGFNWSRAMSALKRHLTAWEAGENTDPESGYSHMEHVLCNAAFLVTFEAREIGTDDRAGLNGLEHIMPRAL